MITGVKQRTSSHSPPTLRRMHSMTPPSTRWLSTGSVWITSGSLLSIQPGSIARPLVIVCKSEAAHARVVEDKKDHEVEEEKKHQEMGERPRKWGREGDVGATTAELSTSGAKYVLGVCTYC